MSQRQAYKEAFDVDYDDNAIDVNACKLFNETKIQLRYKELLEEIKDAAIMTATERMIWLSKIVNGEILEDMPVMTNIKDNKVNTIKCPTKIDTKLKALDTLNKMSGEYKTILDGSVGITKLEDLL
jgi:hypothetical protein